MIIHFVYKKYNKTKKYRTWRYFLFWSEWRGSLGNFCLRGIRMVFAALHLQTPTHCQTRFCFRKQHFLTVTPQQNKKYRTWRYFLFWSEWRDSNPRPFAPQTNTLPDCATPRKKTKTTVTLREWWSE